MMKRSAIQLVKKKDNKNTRSSDYTVQGGWYDGDGGATGMHCPAIKQLPRGQTGDW